MSKRILICDDEEGIRESLKLILSNDYDLVFTENGVQCLDYLQNSNDINLVLLDIKMPKVNGLDILQQIKDKYPNIPVIIVSGYQAFEISSEATRLGATGYIVKPFKKEEILDTIEKNLS